MQELGECPMHPSLVCGAIIQAHQVPPLQDLSTCMARNTLALYTGAKVPLRDKLWLGTGGVFL